MRAVLRRDVDLGDLHAHPLQARNQRLRWGAGAAVALTALVWLLLREYAPSRVGYTWPIGGGLLVVCLILGWDNYRALGHCLTREFIVSRWGTLQRRTSVLDRHAVLGWVFAQTYFQWRLGLVTMTASTAAGAGGYLVRAAGVQQGVDLATEVTPDMFRGFAPGQRQ